MVSEFSNPRVLGNSCAPVVHSRYVCGAPDYLITEMTLDTDTGILSLYQNPDNCLSIQIPAILDQNKVAQMIQGLADDIDAKVDKTFVVRAGNGLAGGGRLENESVTLSVKAADSHVSVTTDGIKIYTFDKVSTSGTVNSPSATERSVDYFLNGLNQWVTINRDSNLSIQERTSSHIIIGNSRGTGITLETATNLLAGLMSAADSKYITYLRNHSLITGINSLVATDSNMYFTYNVLNSNSTIVNQSINIPVVTTSKVGIITPDMLDKITYSTNNGITSLGYNRLTDSYKITGLNRNGEEISSISIPQSNNVYPGLMPSSHFNYLSFLMTKTLVSSILGRNQEDGYQISYSQIDTQNVNLALIPVAGATQYPGLVTNAMFEKWNGYADRDAVTLVEGHARPDGYRINVDTRWGDLQAYYIPVVGEEMAGLVTPEMVKIWNDQVTRKEVLDVTGESNPHEYDITIHFSDDTTNVLNITEATREQAGLMSPEDKFKFNNMTVKSDNLTDYVVDFDNPDTWNSSFPGPKPQYASIYNYYIKDAVTGEVRNDRFYLPIADDNFPGVITAEMYHELLTTSKSSRVIETLEGNLVETGFEIHGVRRSGDLTNEVVVPMATEESAGLITAHDVQVINNYDTRLANIESVIVTETAEDDKEYKSIHLENNGAIKAEDIHGELSNLINCSRWDITEVGDTKLGINLNGSQDRPTYNKTNLIAFTSDIEASLDWYEGD